MARLRFTKMHGAGNDFVLLDALRETLPEGAALSRLAAKLAHRRFGVGCDQVLIARRPSAAAEGGADFRMQIFNADGSGAEMCANGIRAFYKYLRESGHTAADSVRVETAAGVVVPRAAGAQVQVDMGAPTFAPAEIPTTLSANGAGFVLDQKLEAAGRGFCVSALAFGNPHCVVPVDDVAAFDVARYGAALERHPAFPKRANVAFVQVASRGEIVQRTFERGVGETLACGSGACAAAVSQMLRGLVARDVQVRLPGGALHISWAGGNAGGDIGAPVFMTGPAATVYRGEMELAPEPKSLGSQ